MSNSIKELKQAFIEAEERHRAAYRRAVWLERRLYDAPTEADYSRISAELESQEKQLRDLGLVAMGARFAYAEAARLL